MSSWLYKLAIKLAKSALKQNRVRYIMDRNDPNEVYLVRYYLLKNRIFNDNFNVYIHNIGLSDADPWLHDHPWPFITVILSGGYWEQRPGGKKKWHGPGSILFRRASDFHKIELDAKRANGPTWTLFISGPRIKQWGFQTDKGWIQHDKYLKH